MNVIVTGASSGIGFELVKQFVEKENVTNVLAIARRMDRLESLATECDSSKLLVQQFDLKDGEFGFLTNSHFFKKVSEVDVLINNAGLLVNKPFHELTVEDYRNSYEVNVFGPFKLIHASLPWLKRSISAHIVNIGSMGGYQGASKFPGLSAYSSSKGALATLSECLAEEFKEDGIKVNCLALGAVQTEMLEAAFPGFQAPVSPDQMASHILNFAVSGHTVYNGKVLPVSVSTL